MRVPQEADMKKEIYKRTNGTVGKGKEKSIGNWIEKNQQREATLLEF